MGPHSANAQCWRIQSRVALGQDGDRLVAPADMGTDLTVAPKRPSLQLSTRSNNLVFFFLTSRCFMGFISSCLSCCCCCCCCCCCNCGCTDQFLLVFVWWILIVFWCRTWAVIQRPLDASWCQFTQFIESPISCQFSGLLSVVLNWKLTWFSQFWVNLRRIFRQFRPVDANNYYNELKRQFYANFELLVVLNTKFWRFSNRFLVTWFWQFCTN